MPSVTQYFSSSVNLHWVMIVKLHFKHDFSFIIYSFTFLGGGGRGAISASPKYMVTKLKRLFQVILVLLKLRYT